jgi:predicted metallo-beta-lactamase superfamily hydrolase
MKIVPLAFDSLGTRSMATYVETKGLKLVIDPAVSIAPNRFGLMPHKTEIARMEKQWAEIKKMVKKSSVLIITHYHYDHYNPEEPEIYKGKTVLLKNPLDNVNDSQAERAREFIPKIKGIVKEIRYADGTEQRFGETRIVFSQPVFHGIDGRLGYVLEVLVDDGKERFLHTSDVEGPPLQDQVDFIMKHKPATIFLDGPLSYMLYKFGNRALESSFQNMKRIIEEAGTKNLVVDHHFLRDPQYHERIESVVEFGKEHGCRVCTAAEFAGKKVEPLEMKRRELYGKK